MAAEIDENDDRNRTVYVSNLHPRVTKELLTEMFVQAGPLQQVIAKGDETDGRGLGGAKRRLKADGSRLEDGEVDDEQQGAATVGPLRYALIIFKHSASVPFCVEIMDGVRLFDRPLSIRPREGSAHPNRAPTVRRDHNQRQQLQRHRPEEPTSSFRHPSTYDHQQQRRRDHWDGGSQQRDDSSRRRHDRSSHDSRQQQWNGRNDRDRNEPRQQIQQSRRREDDGYRGASRDSWQTGTPPAWPHGAMMVGGGMGRGGWRPPSLLDGVSPFRLPPPPPPPPDNTRRGYQPQHGQHRRFK